MSLSIPAQFLYQADDQTLQGHFCQQATGTLPQQIAPNATSLSAPYTVPGRMPMLLADESECAGPGEFRGYLHFSPPWQHIPIEGREERSCAQRTEQALGVSHRRAELVEGSSCLARANDGVTLQTTCLSELLAEAEEALSVSSCYPQDREDNGYTQRTAKALEVSHLKVEQEEGSSCRDGAKPSETLETTCLRGLLAEAREALSSAPGYEQDSYAQSAAPASGVPLQRAYREQVEGSSCSVRTDGGEVLQTISSSEELLAKLGTYSQDEFTAAPPMGFRFDYNLAEILPTMICAAINDSRDGATIPTAQPDRLQVQKKLD
ncbi:MAG: hypothetical protein K2X93_23290 [Candidatus Obscuribacterales bacterium]|nr:hypothetical protein [Candidatus Obscuribacterales bacterium]